MSAGSGPPSPPRRFLLDQGFPKPVVAIEELDRNVNYIHLSDAIPEFAATSTPDWMVILLAAEQGFAGLVARDKKLLQTPESVVALALNPPLSFITWRAPIEDPVAEWGQLMAYMPLVRGPVIPDTHSGGKRTSIPIDSGHVPGVARGGCRIGVGWAFTSFAAGALKATGRS